MKTAVVSEQGLRSEMENAHFLDTNFANQGWVFGGVYDGHSGSFAAEYAAKYLSEVFLEKLIADSPPQEAFIDSYQEISGRINYPAASSGVLKQL